MLAGLPFLSKKTELFKALFLIYILNPIFSIVHNQRRHYHY